MRISEPIVLVLSELRHSSCRGHVLAMRGVRARHQLVVILQAQVDLGPQIQLFVEGLEIGMSGAEDV